METIELSYRVWHKGLPPQSIKLKIPGWAGDSHEHNDGAKPQPWHCPPFVEGSTYGLELIYPFNECKIINKSGKIEFDGDFSNERPDVGIKWPPFEVFAPGHYGMTSALDIKVPPGYVLRLENHPCYYTDSEYKTPCVVPGHIQTEWWPRIFFVVFKAPPDGQYHIFKKYQPYAQILILPKKVEYDIMPMDSLDAKERTTLENYIEKCDKLIAEKEWKDHVGNTFNDKYKILARIFNKEGEQGVINYLELMYHKQQEGQKQKMEVASKRMKRILVPVNYPYPKEVGS